MSDAEKPLMIIDGKEAEDETSMNDIDPNHIKSVEVLKGDAAVEKYGEKAKNGVILITTKK
jgi:TonB-dependent SusC/RagA subfamily outer membrane receptor